MIACEARIARLERTVRRQRLAGASILALSLLVAAGRQEEAPLLVGDLRARSITVVDAEGHPLVRLDGERCGRVEVLDSAGNRRAYLGEHAPTPGASTLELFDAGSVSELLLLAEPDAANLLMSRDEGERSGLWAIASKDRSMLSFDAAGLGPGASIGAVREGATYGGRLSMHYARPLATGAPGEWASNGSYFIVSPDGRVDRPEDEIRRVEPD